MKHKGLVIILSALVVIAFAILVFVALFSVKDIVVSYSVYGERVTGVEDVLSEYKGKNLLFVNQDEIEKKLKDNFALKIDWVKKVYPSTIEVGVSSRQERYAISTGQGDYYIVDEEYAVVARRSDTSNFADRLNNVVVTFDVDENPSFAVNSSLDAENKYVKAFETVVEGFSSPRDVIESVLIYETAEKGNVRITVKMRVGVSIVVYKALDKTSAKIAAAKSKYESLSDEDKLIGEIQCLESDSGAISAVYTTH